MHTKATAATLAASIVLVQLFGWPIFGSLVGIIGQGESQLPAVGFRIGVILLCIYAAIKARQQPNGLASLFWSCYIAFWLFYIGKLLISIWIAEPQSPLSIETYIGYSLLFGLLPSALSFLDFNREAIDTTARLASKVAFIAIALTLADIAVALLLGRPYFYAAMLRLGSEKMNPIALGHLCTSFLIIYLSAQTRQNNAQRIFGALFLVPGALIVLAFTASKGPILALVICLLLWAIYTFGAAKFFTIALIASVSILFIGGLFSTTVNLGDSVFSPVINRFSGLASGSDDQSTAGRLIAYSGAINQFFENPLIGGLPFEQETFNYPHNLFLEVLMSTGIVGVLLITPVISFFLLSTRNCLKLNEQRWIGLLGAQYFIAAMFSGAIYTNALTWFIIVFVSATNAATQAASRTTLKCN